MNFPRLTGRGHKPLVLFLLAIATLISTSVIHMEAASATNPPFGSIWINWATCRLHTHVGSGPYCVKINGYGYYAVPNTQARGILVFANRQLGKPYNQVGDNGPNAWDCSGLTRGAYAFIGKSLPHSSSLQYTQAPYKGGTLRPGDLTFSYPGRGANGGFGHVMIYIGGGKSIAAPEPGDHVKVQTNIGSTHARWYKA